MTVRFELLEDEEECRELELLAFPYDWTLEEGHTYWVARDEAGKPIGFCSAVYWPSARCVFLSRAAVVVKHQGKGIARKMVKLRLKWGIEQGADIAYTYVTLFNYSSLLNLLRCNFRGYPSPSGKFHHLFRNLKRGRRLKLTPAQVKKFQAMAWKA